MANSTFVLDMRNCQMVMIINSRLQVLIYLVWLLTVVQTWLLSHMTNMITQRWFQRQVYHSSFMDEERVTKACGCPLLPLKSHIKGPAPVGDQGFTCIFRTFI